MLKDQQVPMTAGIWANVVGRLKNRVTPQILSSLSHKKNTDVCHVKVSRFFKTTIFLKSISVYSI